MAHHGQTQKELQLFFHWLNLVREENQGSGGSEWVELFIGYLIKTNPNLSTEKIFKMIEEEKTNSQIKGDIMDLFERLEKKGKKEGKKEGREERDFQTAKNMFQDGLNWDMIQKYTGVGEEKFKQLSTKLENLTSPKHA